MSHTIASAASPQAAIASLLLATVIHSVDYAIDGHVARAHATAASAVEQACSDVARSKARAHVAATQENTHTEQARVDLLCATLTAMRARWEGNDVVAEAADDTDDADTVFELARLDLIEMKGLIRVAQTHGRNT